MRVCVCLFAIKELTQFACVFSWTYKSLIIVCMNLFVTDDAEPNKVDAQPENSNNTVSVSANL